MKGELICLLKPKSVSARIPVAKLLYFTRKCIQFVAVLAFTYEAIKKEHMVQTLELRIPPLVLVIMVAAGMWVLSGVFSALNAPLPGTIALAITASGVMIAGLGVLEFRRANTTVDPRFPDRSSRLVVSGVYRVSRNPMYLGFVLILFGWAWYLANYLAFLLLPSFIIYLNRFQIQPEERYMVQKFGDEFKAYAARVRRWI